MRRDQYMFEQISAIKFSLIRGLLYEKSDDSIHAG